MNDWLLYINKLTEFRDPIKLLDSYCQELLRVFHFRSAFILMLNEDGRLLKNWQQPTDSVWPVDDFDIPFSHVLQMGSMMRLPYEKRLYWQSNRLFSNFCATVSKHEDVIISPFGQNGSQKIMGILVCVGEKQQINAFEEDTNACLTLTILVHHWLLLNSLNSELKKESTLYESLSSMQDKEQQRCQVEQLAKVIIGHSAVMQTLRSNIITAAQSPLTALILGETGTGKELVAQAIHQWSSRHNKPFVAINCAAIPENLLESELFGYEKGAFSGAEKRTQGLIAAANNGTLFLDEMGDLSLPLQAKLLRVLETHHYRPIGSKSEFYSDFRLVVATHENLINNVELGKFRRDLFYRLNQFPLNVPSLKQRKEDINELAEFFIQHYNQQQELGVSKLSLAALDWLKTYDFPGNVRELRNMIEFSCANTPTGEEIQQTHFMKYTHSISQSAQLPRDVVNTQRVREIQDLRQAVDEFEREVISDRLSYFNGSKAKTAESLSIPKRTLAYKCVKLEIEK